MNPCVPQYRYTGLHMEILTNRQIYTHRLEYTHISPYLSAEREGPEAMTKIPRTQILVSNTAL